VRIAGAVIVSRQHPGCPGFAKPSWPADADQLILRPDPLIDQGDHPCHVHIVRIRYLRKGLIPGIDVRSHAAAPFKKTGKGIPFLFILPYYKGSLFIFCFFLIKTDFFR
jgi:hypothetical protein